MKDILDDTVRICRLAGKLLTDSLLTDFSVHRKGEVDLVTDVDQAAQDLVEREILLKYPDHSILAEEDLDITGTAGFKWIVDPLDGTTNYAHHFPVFSISIAVVQGNDVVCGVVYNPVSEELFKAVKGEGASLNAMPIKVSGTKEIGDSLLATGFPYDIRDTSHTNLDHFLKFVPATQGVRCCGSAALDLCFVACGRLDGFWELNLKPWDVAAGALIVREAGGVTTNFAGDELSTDGSRVLASNGKLHGAIQEILQTSI